MKNERDINQDQRQFSNAASVEEKDSIQEGTSAIRPPQLAINTSPIEEDKPLESIEETATKEEKTEDKKSGKETADTPPADDNNQSSNSRFQLDNNNHSASKKAGKPASDKEEDKNQKEKKKEKFQLESGGEEGGNAGNGLPNSLNNQMESAFNADFSNVSIHKNSQKAKEIGAYAFTQGNDIHFAPGQYQPFTPKGQELIGHELTHVVQQSESTVSPTSEVNGMPVNDNKALEQEADTKGKKATKNNTPNKKGAKKKPTPKPVAQGKFVLQKAAAPGKTPNSAPANSKQTTSPVAQVPTASAQVQAPTAVSGGDFNVKAFLQTATNAPFQLGKSKINVLSTNEQTKKTAPTKVEESKQATIAPAGETDTRIKGDAVKTTDNKPTPDTREAKAKNDLKSKLSQNMPTKLKHVDNFKKDGKAGIITSAGKSVIRVDKGGIVTTYRGINTVNPQAGSPPTEPEWEDASQEEINAYNAAYSAWESSLNGIPDEINNSVPLPDIEDAPLTDALKLSEEFIPDLKPIQSHFNKDKEGIDKKIADEGITKVHLDMVDSGELLEVKEGVEELDKIEDEIPDELETVRTEEQSNLDGELNTAEETGRQEMRTERETELEAARDIQNDTKMSFEEKRAAVVAHIYSIYNPVKEEVSQTLSDLETQSHAEFKAGMDKAAQEFEDNVDKKIKAYKDERYSGATGWLKWLDDLLTGINDHQEVKDTLETERDIYVGKIDTLIATITTRNKGVIEECKVKINDARTKIDAFISGLEGDLLAAAQSAQFDIEQKLLQLEEDVEKKEQDLIAMLQVKRDEAIRLIDEKIEKLKEKWEGVLSKILKFIGELALEFLKWALNSVGLDADKFINTVITIGKAIWAIIKDPIGFIKNLVAIVKGGFQLFFSDPVQNLLSALIGWLTGNSGDIQLPETFDLKGILMMVLDFFGVGWEMIKGLFAEQLGPQLVDFAISGIELITNIIQDGPIAIWNMVKGEATENWPEARQKMVDNVGEDAVKNIEDFYNLIKGIQEDGPEAIWEFVKTKSQDIVKAIKDMIIEKLIDWGVGEVLKKGIATVMAIATGFIGAIKAIYNGVMFFVKNIDVIGALCSALLGALADAALGAVGSGINRIFTAIGLVIQLLIALLAELIGLSGIPEAVGKVIDGAIGAVQNFLAKAVEWISNILKKIWAKIKSWFTKDEEGGTDGNYDDLSHDQKVAQGLSYIHKLEDDFVEEDRIKEEDAQDIVNKVKEGEEDKTKRTGKGQIFSKLEVTDTDLAGNENGRWNYLWSASPDDVEEGWFKWRDGVRWLVKEGLEELGIDIDMFIALVGDSVDVLKALWDNPGAFMSNLVDAVKGGFNSYTANIGDNIKDSLASWLTGSTGMEVPSAWDAKGMFGMALDALDLKWDTVKGYLIEELGAPIVDTAIAGWGFLSTVITEGPIALWNDMVDTGNEVQGTIVDSLKQWAITEILEAGAFYVLGFLTPATGFVNVVKSIWRMIQFFYSEATKIMELFTTIGASIADIAAGNISGAISMVDSGLQQMTTLLVSFLAKILGISNVRYKIKKLLDNVRVKIKNALQKAVKKLAGYIKDWGSDTGQDFRTYQEKEQDLNKAIKEADVHVLNEDLDDDETEAKFPAIKQKYQMKELILVTESETEFEEIVYAHGEINPELDGKKGSKEKEFETNQDYIDGYLGTILDENDVPIGYEIYDRKPNGSKKIRRKPGNANPSFVKLGIESIGQDGDEYSTENFIRPGENKPRISTPGKLATNVGGSPENHQFHHLIPDAVVRDHPLAQAARSEAGYDVDRASNGLRMPCNEIGQQSTNLPLHKGSHSSYNTFMYESLNDEEGMMDELDEITKDDYEYAMEAVENIGRVTSRNAFPKVS